MKLSQALQDDTFTLSFEVFPPKSSDVYDSVENATEEIARLRPSFMSVTFGAGGGTSRYTLEIAESIRRTCGVPSVVHLTCVASTRETVRQRIRDFQAAGVENVLALRGDIPAGHENDDRSTWDYQHAVELVRELKESGADFCVGGACYPEVHPDSPNQREDIRRLKEKVDAGCDFLTTQMFFDNNLFYSFLYKIREAGITVPVLPGIMPITMASQMSRMVKLSGSFMPHRFQAMVDRFGGDSAAMKQAGIAYATDQIIDLFANGIRHVHVYTMNKPDVAAKIQANLSDILGKHD